MDDKNASYVFNKISVGSKRMGSEHVACLKQFIGLSDELLKSIDSLRSYQDDVLLNREYQDFSRKVMYMRNKAIIECYEHKKLKWD